MGEAVRFCRRCQEYRPHVTKDGGASGACRQCGQGFGPSEGSVELVAALEDELAYHQSRAADAASRLRIAQARQESDRNGEGQFDRETRALAAALNVACPEHLPPIKFLQLARPVFELIGRPHHAYRAGSLDHQDVAEIGGAND